MSAGKWRWHIPVRNNSVHSQLRSYFCPLPSLTMTPVVKYQWRKEEALLVHLSLIQGSDGRGDRGALFQQAESCFPRECKTTLWFHWHSGLNAMTQWLPTGSPSAPMSIFTLIKPLSASSQRASALMTQWWRIILSGMFFLTGTAEVKEMFLDFNWSFLLHHHTAEQLFWRFICAM